MQKVFVMEQKSFFRFVISGRWSKRFIAELLMISVIICMAAILAAEYYSVEKRAGRGELAAQIKMAEKCLKNKRNQEAEFWLAKALDQNDCTALLLFGDLYRQFPEWNAKAVMCYEKAAVYPENHPAKAQALMRLSSCYYQGEGVPENLQKAHELMLKAAELNVAEAQWKVGCYYRNQQQECQALEWFSKAAEANYSKAMLELGYYCGKQNDHKNALEWYTRAAGQNDAEALNLLGELYYLGKYVDKDEKKAENYFLEAAQAGSVTAEYNLALYYEYLYRISKAKDEDTRKKAYYWAKRAWAGGKENVKNIIKIQFD